MVGHARAASFPFASLLVVFGLGACSDAGPGPGPGLDDFLPEVPEPTGAPPSVAAGAITQENASETVVHGPAARSMVGDYFMRNARVHLAIQAPVRSVGPVPQGGNIIDAVPLDADGVAVAGDHFGEIAPVYLLGRTCEHTSVEVVHDGSGGGAAVVRARGMSATNDMLNIRALGLLPVVPSLDPDIEDQVACATTYILEPDAPYLRVLFTFYNPGEWTIRGPFGVIGDSGGEVAPWAPERGFSWASVFANLRDTPPPVPYEMAQGPGVAYGLAPRHEDASTPNASFIYGNRLGLFFGAPDALSALDRDLAFLELPGQSGVTHAMDIIVGRDAASVDAVFRERSALPLAELTGRISWASGAPATRGRVGVFRDVAGDGLLDDDDVIVSYMDVASDGTFSGRVPPDDNYLVRAEITDIARSAAEAVALASGDTVDIALALPDPVLVDYTVVDDESGAYIPGKVAVIGRHPIAPDARISPMDDRLFGVVRMVHAVRGTTVDVGDGADPMLELPPGANYRIVVSRGTEWSVAEQTLALAPGDGPLDLEFRLRRVAPAVGYLSSEYHVHQLGSRDSQVAETLRVATMAADGVELFAGTDHDHVTDLQPVVEALGLTGVVRAMTGLEVTTEGYGHFNVWPLAYDDTTPDHGAVDWARGMQGHAMIPGEIFADARRRGAELVQVNHPRLGLEDDGESYRYFDRAGVRYDLDARQIVGDAALAPIPNEWLRLPETTLWDDSFNALEVWNGFNVLDSNGDGVREISSLDSVLRDYFNLLSMGLEVTPTANSDTHDAIRSPSGIPRTYVRVTDDSEDALRSGQAVMDALDTLSGVAPRDLVLSNGPHITVRIQGQGEPAIGRVLDGTSGSVTLDIEVIAPVWAEFDTLEIFANMTPEVDTAITALEPLLCFTSRDPTSIDANDVCALSAAGAQAMTVERQTVAPGFERFSATLAVTIDRADIVNRAGATGADAWLVVRARGDRAIAPLLLYGVLDDDTLDAMVTGAPAEVDAILRARGVPAHAMTAPLFVDFDGGGYRAIFAP